MENIRRVLAVTAATVVMSGTLVGTTAGSALAADSTGSVGNGTGTVKICPVLIDTTLTVLVRGLTRFGAMPRGFGRTWC
jgi:hypothetical protein